MIAWQFVIVLMEVGGGALFKHLTTLENINNAERVVSLW